MSPDRLPPDDPREWLNRARSNLLKAQANVPGIYPEDLCFDAQQAAKKAITAVLIARGIAFPYVHDLAKLLSLLEPIGEHVPLSLDQAARLTSYAVVTRYPGLFEPITVDEYEQAMALAEAIVGWAAERIEGGPGAPGEQQRHGGTRRMDDEQDAEHRHESVDHAHPTDAGLMDPDGDEVPGTGIAGDETLVRDADGEGVPGIYPAPAAHTGGAAHPGPTPADEDG